MAWRRHLLAWVPLPPDGCNTHLWGILHGLPIRNTSGIEHRLFRSTMSVSNSKGSSPIIVSQMPCRTTAPPPPLCLLVPLTRSMAAERLVSGGLGSGRSMPELYRRQAAKSQTTHLGAGEVMLAGQDLGPAVEGASGGKTVPLDIISIPRQVPGTVMAVLVASRVVAMWRHVCVCGGCGSCVLGYLFRCVGGSGPEKLKKCPAGDRGSDKSLGRAEDCDRG